MINNVKNKILYNGISDYIPENLSSFTQTNIDKIIKIENLLIDIDEIMKVNVDSIINDSNLVKTAIGMSLEGQKLTGYKYLAEGQFNIRIDFFVYDEKGSVYSIRDTVYFNSATTLEEDINVNSRLISNVYIEDIYCEKISGKEILINITFVFAVEDY